MKLESEFSVGKSEKDLLSILYFNNPEGLTDSKAADLLKVEKDRIKVYRQRLGENVAVMGSERPQRYTLSPNGRAQLELSYWEWRRNLDNAKRQELALREASNDLRMQYLDLPAQIDTWRSFFENEPYKSGLYAQVGKGQPWLMVRFADLAKHSPELADILLAQPEETLKAAEIAIDKIDIPSSSDEAAQKIAVRIIELPDVTSLGMLETQNLGKFLQVEAQVVVAGERRSQTTMARFECPTCGNIVPIIQVEQKFREPNRCSCGRKGRFKLLAKDRVDAMSLLVQQPISELAGKAVQPSTLKVLLQRDLTRPHVRDQLGLSKIVRIGGVLEEVPVILKTGGTATRADWRFNANSITVVEHYDPQIRLTPERIKHIKAEAQRPDFIARLRESYFPHHIGDDMLRELLVVQSVAMPLHLHTAEARAQADREAVHIVIMTPPGMGKSRNLAGRLLDIVPIKGRANGTGATRAGLTIGADQKDPESDLIIPSPQAIPKANLGLFVFDELDKMNLDEQPVLNEALSEHMVTVAKRGVNLTLPAMVCLLGLANPRSYDWNLDQERLQEILNIHYTLLTRCVIWVGTDEAKEDRDQKVALAILRRDEQKPRPYDDEFLRDYVLLARASVVPHLTPEHEEILAQFYARLRQIQTRKYIGPRFIEQARSLILLHAKAHLRTSSSIEDIRWTNDVLIKQLLNIGFDPNRLPNTLPRMV